MKIRIVSLRFQVLKSESSQDAVEMATNYFCGGDNYREVTQLAPEVVEMEYEEESEAAKA
jgi:hypothetical protein